MVKNSELSFNFLKELDLSQKLSLSEARRRFLVELDQGLTWWWVCVIWWFFDKNIEQIEV
jgi:hypothetical protein